MMVPAVGTDGGAYEKFFYNIAAFDYVASCIYAAYLQQAHNY